MPPMHRPLPGYLAHLHDLVTIGLLALACKSAPKTDAVASSAPVTSLTPRAAPNVTSTNAAPRLKAPRKVEHKDTAMGTSLHFVGYTNLRVDEPAAQAAFTAAVDEMRRLESVLSEWRSDTELGRVNLHPGEWVTIGDELGTVLDKSLWASRISQGTFDVTFQVMSDVWKFGTSQDPNPKLPDPREIARRRAFIDYRRVELDLAGRRVRMPRGFQIGLGGIAKGYIVDRASDVLQKAGLASYLVQAGGDLYGAGRKPDGTSWVSGIQDPRGQTGSFFATIGLEDHAFSTAGDYARSFVVNGQRYHHIIDPRTGYPATASRSVTVWAKDAFTADAVDDAVFILGPEKGLALVESLEGVGAVIVDRDNRVHVSRRIENSVEILKQPTPGD
jgi:thiamine biosynthesis lipoprotein